MLRRLPLFTKRGEEKKLKQKQNVQKTVDILSLFPYIASNDSLPLKQREEKKKQIQFYVEPNDARTMPMVEKVLKTV